MEPASVNQDSITASVRSTQPGSDLENTSYLMVHKTPLSFLQLRWLPLPTSSSSRYVARRKPLPLPKPLLPVIKPSDS